MINNSNETYWVIRDQDGILTMHQMKGKPQTNSCNIIGSYPPVPSCIALTTLNAVITKKKVAQNLIKLATTLEQIQRIAR